jgi:adenine deaminase
MSFEIKGNLVDVHRRKIFPAKIYIKKGKIEEIKEVNEKFDTYIVPPLVDASINLEKTFLSPIEYSKVALIHGVVSSIVRVPQISRSLGKSALSWLYDNANDTYLKFRWSVDPYITDFYSRKDILSLLENPDTASLGNIENVKFNKDTIYEMVFSQSVDKPIVASGKYISSKDFPTLSAKGVKMILGCKGSENIKEAINNDMYVAFDSVSSFVNTNSTKSLFCSNGRSVDNLVCEYIDDWVRESLNREYDVFRIFQVSSINPVKLYNLNVGLLSEGDCADFLVVDNLKAFNVLETYVDGVLVVSNGLYLEKSKKLRIPSKVSSKNGLSVSNGEYSKVFKLPILGYLSELEYMDVVEEYTQYMRARSLLSKKKGS